MKQIVILDRGWVFMGQTQETERGVCIREAQCIRRWGTNHGLGEIAKHGPQPNTVLDDVGTVSAPWSSVIALLDCEEEEV